MALSIPFLTALLFTSVAIGQSGLSSTSRTTCLTKLGTSSVAPIPTTTNMRSLTINTIQKSTYTPTATSTPPDTTTTISYTEFPTTTTTVFNSEVDTFSTTTTIIDQQLSTATVVVTTTQTNTQYTSVYGTTTVPTPPFFIPAKSAQANDRPIKNKKRGVGPLARIAARQTASAASVSVPATNYVYTEAVSCTGVVEYYSVKASVVATAAAITNTLPVITDTTSTTKTTTITSSVLQTPASTTETISSTITTTSLAGTFTSTATATAGTVVTVQGPQSTVYAACQANNIISTDRDGNPIHALVGPSPFFGTPEGPEAVLSGSSSYACCVACITTYGSTCGGAAFNTQNGQCLIYDGTRSTSGNLSGGYVGFSQILGYHASAYSNSYSGPYILSDGPCGATIDDDPSF